MALDPQGVRDHGVNAISPSDLEGSRGADGDGVNLPTSTYRNPGPTENLRGIEANTALHGSSIVSAPEVQTDTVGGYTRDAPFDANSPLGTTVGPGDPAWGAADSSARNSHATDIPHDSFSAVGESYPANGGLDGRT